MSENDDIAAKLVKVTIDLQAASDELSRLVAQVKEPVDATASIASRIAAVAEEVSNMDQLAGADVASAAAAAVVAASAVAAAAASATAAAASTAVAAASLSRAIAMRKHELRS